jgi:hypothetical protein
MSAPRLEAIAPIGTRPVTGFWNGHDPKTGRKLGYETRDVPAYPEHPRGQALAKLRRDHSISLGNAARLLALTPEQLSGLEHGRYRFIDESEWDKAKTILEGYA